jgi:chromosome segregation ATPase
MFDIDFLISFFLMSILFLRQIMILKQPNKINYAPLILSIGAISSIVHFVLHPESTNFVLSLRESLIPMLMAFILYIIMNILHQTQLSMNAKMQDEFTQTVAYEVSQLKAFLLELEQRMNHTQEISEKSHEDIRKNFVNDIQILDTILTTQKQFLEKFDEMKQWHNDVDSSFKYFSEVQLPELDNVVHKHIDILRVAEQDHYNKLMALMQEATKNRFDISESIEVLEEKLDKIGSMADKISESIVEKTLGKINSATDALESEIVLLKSHTEALKTSLYEGENTLSNIKLQSEMIMKQMVLSAQKMDELEVQNNKMYTLFTSIDTLIENIHQVEEDYNKAQEKLSDILNNISDAKTQEIQQMKETIEELSETLATKVDESLENLHEHYHITSEDISQSVKILAKKAQLQKGYGES